MMYLNIKNYKNLEDVEGNITIYEYPNQYNIHFDVKLLNYETIIADIPIKFEILRKGIAEEIYKVYIKINTKCIGYLEIGMDVLESVIVMRKWIYDMGKKIIEQKMGV
jgi:hypothetical protein